MSRLSVVLLILAVGLIATTQYATVALSVTVNVTTNQQGLIWFGAGDKAGDGKYALRADSDGADAYLYFYKVVPGGSKEYSAAFAIVNEEKFGIMVTKIDVQDVPTGLHVYIYLDDNTDPGDGNTPAYEDGTVSSLTYHLATGDDDATTVTDSSGTSHTVSYDSSSHTKPLDTSWVGSDGSSDTQADFVWVTVKVVVDSGTGAGDYSFTISIDFQSTS